MDGLAGAQQGPLAAAGLALVAVLLAAWGALSARPPAEAVPDAAGYLRRWTAVHGGYDATSGNAFLRGWLLLAYRVARPLARRGVAPDVLTAATTWLAAAVLATGAAGGRWPLLGCALLVASGLGDTLDGCVAVLTDRATRWGYVLEAAVDRVNDGIYLLAVVALGAPGWLAVATGVAFGMLEYLRARAANAGTSDVVVVTVGERANRVICCAVAMLAAGAAPTLAPSLATAGLALLAVLSFAGLAQLVLAAHRQLTTS